MKYKVVYFTRTGTCKRIAEKIANQLACEKIEITDDQNWHGFIGFMKGGFYALWKKPVNIKMDKSLDNPEQIIAITPMWAGRITPAIYTFLKDQDLSKVHLLVASGGSILKERSGYKTVYDIIKSEKNENSVIQELIQKL